MHQTLETIAATTQARSEVEEVATIDDLQDLRRRLAAPAHSELGGLRNVFSSRRPARILLADVAD